MFSLIGRFFKGVIELFGVFMLLLFWAAVMTLLILGPNALCNWVTLGTLVVK